MKGETDLSKLIQGMKPKLHEGEYVFCTLIEDKLPDVTPLCLFQESEGITIILTKQQAESLSLSYSFVSAWITLTVHSGLEAVGFLAVISRELAQVGISCNVVSAYYHDHLFVPVKEAQRAMSVLQAISH